MDSKLKKIFSCIVILIYFHNTVYGQYNGNLPNTRQTYINLHIGGSNNTVTFPENVISGNTFGVCITDNSGAGTSTYGITSTPSETWTVTAPIRTPDVAPNIGQASTVAIAYAVAGSTAQYVVNATSTSGTHILLEPFELEHVSGSVDGSVVSNTANGSATSLTNTVVTTINGDAIINCSAAADFSPGLAAASANNSMLAVQYNANNINSTFHLTTGMYTGLSGSYTPQIDFIRFGGTSSTYAMESLAFKPLSGINVATTVLSDADTISNYKDTLIATGGTGAYTWSIVTGSLPSGLSLNTSTGIISGLATTLGTYNIGVRATDGTLTSSTKNLTIHIYNSFNTPNIIQSKVCFTTISCTFSNPVTAGNREILIAMGIDTHGNEGWFSSPQNITTTQGTVFKMLPQNTPSAFASPLDAYEGIIPSCGSETITYTQMGTGSNLVYLAQEVANVQDAVDTTVGNSVRLPTSPATYNTSYTTQVPNELIDVFSFATSAVGVNDPTAMSIGSPFTSISSGIGGASFGFYAISFDQTSIVSTYTAPTTVTFPSSTDTIGAGTYMLGLRANIDTTLNCGKTRHFVTQY